MRTRRSLLNLATGLSYSATMMAVGLYATPRLLDLLGADRYGASRIALDWFGYLTLIELGLGDALAPLLGLSVGSADRGATARALAVSIRAFVRATLFKLLAWCAFAVVITRVIPVGPGLAPDLQRAALVGVTGLALSPLLPFRTLAEAHQRGYVVNALLLLQSLTMTGLSLLFASLGQGITGQFMALVLGSLPFHLALTVMGLLRYPATLALLKGGDADAGTRDRLRAVRGPAFLLGLFSRVSVHSDSIVIGLLLSPRLAVPFLLTQRLPMLAQAQVQGIGNAIWASLAELHAKRETGALRRILVELTSLVAIVALSLLVPIAAFNHAFVARWVGQASYGGDLLTVLAAGNAVIQSIISLWGWFFTSAGRLDRLVRVSAIGAAVNVGASLVLTRYLGLAGPVAGTAVMFAVVLPLWLAILRRDLQVPTGEVLRAIARPAALALPYGTALWLYAGRYPPPSWLALAAAMAISGMGFVVLGWLLILDGNQRDGVRARVRSVLPVGNGGGRF